MSKSNELINFIKAIENSTRIFLTISIRLTNGKSLFKIVLEKTFGSQNKLLHLAGRTVNYGALNGPIIAHVLTERYNKWFYLIIYSFNDLKIPAHAVMYHLV